jgi:hypothetical protein
MADIKLNQLCSACAGTGIRKYNATPGGTIIEENPCVECGGDGQAIAPLSIDPTWFDAQEEIIADTYDKVKKIKKTVDDIWAKVNV